MISRRALVSTWADVVGAARPQVVAATSPRAAARRARAPRTSARRRRATGCRRAASPAASARHRCLSCSASASAAAPASRCGSSSRSMRLVGLAAVRHPDVGHDRRVLRVAAELAEAEDPRRELAQLEPHAADPRRGIGVAGRRRQRRVDVGAHPGVADRVAPVDELLLDVVVEPREPRRERRQRERRLVRRRQRVGEVEVVDRRCGCPSTRRARSPLRNATTHWRLRSERTWLSITPRTRNRWRPQSWSGSGSGAICPPASETSTCGTPSTRSRARGCRRRRRRRAPRARGTRRGRGRCRPRRPRSRRAGRARRGRGRAGTPRRPRPRRRARRPGWLTRPTRQSAMYGLEKRNSAPDCTLVALITKRGWSGRSCSVASPNRWLAVGLGRRARRSCRR